MRSVDNIYLKNLRSVQACRGSYRVEFGEELLALSRLLHPSQGLSGAERAEVRFAQRVVDKVVNVFLGGVVH